MALQQHETIDQNTDSNPQNMNDQPTNKDRDSIVDHSEKKDDIIQQQSQQLQRPPPVQNIVMPTPDRRNGSVFVDNTFHRAIHKIRLQALVHNYSEVESTANRQRCSVIVVVKADGYGHGAIPTALFLADQIGADAFAVATLEEGVALRKALQQTQPTTIPILNRLGNNQINSNGNSGSSSGPHSRNPSFQDLQQQDYSTIGTNEYYSSSTTINGGRGIAGGGTSMRRPRKSLRPSHVRILVLGPPVGFPRCFDDYYHHNIEVMISGPEVAKALFEWVINKDERMHKQVERAANEAKERILLEQHHHHTTGTGGGPAAAAFAAVKKPKHYESMDSTGSFGGGENSISGSGDNNSIASSTKSGQSSSNPGPLPPQVNVQQEPQYHPPTATLSNVTGSDLAKEVRAILRNQKMAAESQQITQSQPASRKSSMPGVSTTATAPTVPTTLSARSSTQDLYADGKDNNQSSTTRVIPTDTSTRRPSTSTTTSTTVATSGASTMTTTLTSTSTNVPSTAIAPAPATTGNVQVFAGIEEAAKYSRTRQKAATSVIFHESGDDDEEEEVNVQTAGNELSRHMKSLSLQSEAMESTNSDDAGDSLAPITPIPQSTQGVSATATAKGTKSRIPTNTNRNALPPVVPPKKRLRWHALVDSGMGRLGFRTDPVLREDQGKRRDSVEILKDLVDLEVTLDCPIEFYGMCTHMADANSNSTYTHSQINKFKNLLKRVRAAGISVPTISTDNSAALLTTNLTHFDAKELLTQADADSRGFVRTGGAIYGQRPAFKQLHAVSTLMASVRHVAILKEGESVGYDRAYVAPMNVRIATLTIGFADGYPRELGNGVGNVSIRGHLFPVAGNVCMDMLMVELGPAGDRHGIGAQVVVGDTAILWGPDDGEDGEGHVPLKDLAATLKTTQSALTCGLNKERVLRQYS